MISDKWWPKAQKRLKNLQLNPKCSKPKSLDMNESLEPTLLLQSFRWQNSIQSQPYEGKNSDQHQTAVIFNPPLNEWDSDAVHPLLSLVQVSKNWVWSRAKNNNWNIFDTGFWTLHKLLSCSLQNGILNVSACPHVTSQCTFSTVTTYGLNTWSKVTRWWVSNGFLPPTSQQLLTWHACLPETA